MNSKHLFCIAIFSSLFTGSLSMAESNRVDSIKVIGNVEVTIVDGQDFKVSVNPDDAAVSYVDGVGRDFKKLVVEGKPDKAASIAIQLPKLLSLEISKGAKARASLSATEEMKMQSAKSKALLSGSLKKLVLSSSGSEIDLSESDLSSLQVSSSDDDLLVKAKTIAGALNATRFKCLRIPESFKVAKNGATISGCN